MAGDNSTVHSKGKVRRRHRRRKNKQPALVDSISSLPDDILQHILSFVLTKLAIRTSVLSKRWRHVWCDTPSLSFHHSCKLQPANINDILNRYTALKMMRFHFDGYEDSIDYIDTWIEFAMSRNVENLSFDIWLGGVEYEFPDYFYNNSSLKQLTLALSPSYVNPPCYVSWTSLKNLSLCWCKLPNESIAKILSGCPILESLSLDSCKELSFLDLSKYPNIATLRVRYNLGSAEPTEIVAPYIHSLKLRRSHLPCTLLDVSSLTEAKLNNYQNCYNNLNAYIPQVKLLEILQNVEKLTLGERFLKILSLAEIHDVPFPMLKMKSMTVKTSIYSHDVILGIERMLQNSPELKKITVHIKTYNCSISERELDNYCVIMELILKNAEALEKLVVLIHDNRYHKFKALVPTISNKNNVSIVFSTKSTKHYRAFIETY